MHLLTLAEISKGLSSGDFSSRELVEFLLSRIDDSESLNAFINVTADHALSVAGACDKARSKGEDGALCGLPIVYKDIFCTKAS